MRAFGFPIPAIYPALILPLLMAALAGCGETDPTAPPGSSQARGGPGTPAVKATDPSSALRNTTLTVRVLGSGFQPDARAVWALDGDTAFAVTRIRTNTTEYVSSTELRANISIEGDAQLQLFDVVAINSNGKKGIGIELFAVTVEILDLGVGSPGAAQAVNEAGQIVGETGTRRPFLWSGGALTELLPPGMTGGVAYDINESGEVVVSAYNASTVRGFLWSGGSFHELPPPAGYCCSQAYAINDAGEVAGHVTVAAGGGPHAAIWRARVPTDLQAASGGEGFAWDINNHGEVIGTFYTDFNGSGSQGSFTWTQASGLQPLGGSLDGGEALGINDNGQIVGWSPPEPGQPMVAYLWENGTKQFLGALGGPGSVAMAITEQGVVVGRADLPRTRRGWPMAAFRWTGTGGMENLGKTASYDLAWAHDANDAGVVVGQMFNSRGGSQQATRWRLP
jgi:probable HAF family extracellular repeat protein